MNGAAAGRLLLLCLWAPVAGGAWAADVPIYSCVDASGKKLTSDRPIAECTNREQKLHNSDGSLRRIVPPTPTSDERAAQQDAVRRDRNLTIRFPNEAAHRRAREAALDDVRKAVRTSEERLKLLAAERKPLLDEAEFYSDRQLPAKIRQSLDANDAAVEAQRTLVLNQQAEIVRINNLFDVELERLRRLWAGAPPGSMGVLPVTPVASASASAPRKAGSK